MAKILLADGSSQIYRAYHAMARGAGRPLSAPDGTPTGALHAFLQVLRKALRDHEPDRVAVTFDLSGKTFRDELFPEYKANRDAMPEDLRVQLDLARQALHALNLAVVEIRGYEADDVIATLVERAAKAGDEVVILSSDKDLLQLVRPGVVMHHALRDRVYDEEGAEEYFGAPPARVVDVQSIMGDSIDNIPGVTGIGEKGAKQLVAAYGDLETILASTEAIAENKELGGRRKRMAKLLDEQADQARLSLKLVTLDRDVPLKLTDEEMANGPPDREASTELFGRLGMARMLEELGMDAPEIVLADHESAGATYRTVRTVEELKALAKRLRAAGRFAFDTETDSRNPMAANLVGISACTEAGDADYVPLGHRDGEQVGLEDALEILGPVFADASVEKVGQHVKFDIKVLRRHCFELEGLVFDTMLASYMTDPARRGHGLDQLASDLLGYRTIKYDDVAGSGTEQLTLDAIDIEDVTTYCCEDADVALQLVEKLAPRIEEDELTRVFEDIEMPLVPVLADMELAGVRIDADRLGALSSELEQRLEALTHEIHDLAGREFSVASPKQLAEVLFDELGLKPRGRTAKTRARSTAVEVLEQLASEHALPGLVLEHRELSKLKGTYLDTLPALADERTGRVHTTYGQVLAATGRLNSSDPNLQNIPIRTEMGRRIRLGFVPDPGCVLVGADYSQVELRIMAHLSGDEALRDAFARGDDIHAATAAHVFGVMPELVTPEMRTRAKEVNFGVLYGMTAFGLSERLRIPRGEAQSIIDSYFGAMPRVRETIDDLIEKCRTEPKQRSRTLFGRARSIPDIVSRNKQLVRSGERVAVNSVVQGSAADLIKLAMVKLHARLRTEEPDARLILQVHDELVVECPEDRAESVRDVLVETMEGVHPLDVPLDVVAGIGSSWYDLK